jgi:hypothetical protein
MESTDEPTDNPVPEVLDYRRPPYLTRGQEFAALVLGLPCVAIGMVIYIGGLIWTAFSLVPFTQREFSKALLAAITGRLVCYGGQRLLRRSRWYSNG